MPILFFLSLFSPLVGLAETTLIVLSVDGIGYQQLQKIDPDFIQENNVSLIKSVNPSFTFPAHASMATGKSPSEHGILTNIPSDKEMEGISRRRIFQYGNSPDRLKFEPFWTTAAQIGVSVQTHLWSNSYGPWNGIHHHENQEYQRRFRYESFERSILMLSDFLNSASPDKKNLYVAWTEGLDKVGHKYGPLHEKTKEEWTQSIRPGFDQLKQIVAKFNIKTPPLQIVLVSDHGMAANEDKESPIKGVHGQDPEENPEMNGIIFGIPRFDDQTQIPKRLEDLKDFVLSYFVN